MPPAVPKVSTNAFNNSQTLLGQLAQAINQTKVLAGIFNGGAAVNPGTRVKIDSTVTTPGVVKFLPAADNEGAFGVIISTPQAGQISPGDNCEVAFQGSQCITEVASGTLTPGTPVAMSSGYLAAVDGTHLQMGLLIDYVTISTPGRVIIGWSAV